MAERESEDLELQPLLVRATEDPPDTLVPRVRAAVLTELSSEPAVARSTGQRGRHHVVRWAAVGIAAAVTAVLGAGLVLRAVDDSDDLTTTATDPGSPFLLPTVWPEDMADRTTSTGTFDSVPRPWDGPSKLLARDGQPEAIAIYRRQALPNPEELPLETGLTLADGRRAVHLGTGTSLMVELAPDRTMSLWSDTSIEELQLLALSFDDEGDVIELPDGWQVVSDPTGVLSLAFGGEPPPVEGYLATRDNGSDPFRTAVMVSAVVAQAPAGVDLVLEQGGSRVEEVDLGPHGRGAVVRPLGNGVRTLVWAPSTRVLAMVGGTGMDDDELIAMARSVEPVSEAEWRALMPSDQPEDSWSSSGPAPTTTALGDSGPEGTVVGG
jgi:hypothetical protein